MARENSAPDALERLFKTLAEELKLPLQLIARQAELQSLYQNQAAPGALHDIQTTADMSLQLLDNYLLSVQLLHEPDTVFAAQPVAVGAVLHDVRRQLKPAADLYGVELRVDMAARYEPVLVHRQALTGALVSLGYSLVEALPAIESTTSQLQLNLAAHRTKYGIVAGLYCEAIGLHPQALRRAQLLQGQARQPLVGVLPGAAAGVFVADAILGAMHTHLRVGRYQKMPGLVATLPASSQLQLV